MCSDNVASAALKKQISRKTTAENSSYVDARTAHVVTVLPLECKDDAALTNSNGGMIVLRKKHEELERPCAVLTVLGLALSRAQVNELDTR